MNKDKKTKSVNDVVEKAKGIIATKNDEIRLLKQRLVREGGERVVTFKMPEMMEVANFPAVQRVHIENQPKTLDVNNFPAVQRVHIENQPKTLDVNVINMKDVVVRAKIDAPKSDKAASWVPSVVKHAAVAIVAGLAKRLDMGILMRADPEDKLRPQAVIVVDTQGRPVNMRGNSSIAIPMPNSPGGQPPPNTIGSGRVTVTTPGVAVQLLSGTGAVSRKVFITAPSSNGGAVYVGGSSVSAVAGSEQGVLLNPTGSATIDIDNINKVWIDADTAGEGVTFTYVR